MKWCGREDSNFHPCYRTATSTLRVYQFRHDRNRRSADKFARRAGSAHVAKAVVRNKGKPACARGRGPQKIASARASALNSAMDNFSRFMVELDNARQTRNAPMGPAQPGLPPVRWEVADGLTDYAEAVGKMEKTVAAIRDEGADERVWLVEHPPLYTAGTSARDIDLLTPDRFPVHRSGRGGQFTYHGPGQRIAYVMLDLNRRRRDVRAYVCALQDWIIAALGDFNIRGECRPGRVGVWISRPDEAPLSDGTPAEDKIAAIGIRLRRWVCYHGIAINIDPDLEHYGGIVPCGVAGHGVTSLVDLGLPATMADVDIALKRHFAEVFGPVD
jgi:lipoyl(octanoyl) transferase